MRRFVGALLVSLVALWGAPRAAAEAALSPPVEGAVIDPFRPPATEYGPGNRGLDYATSPGEEVRAASGGEVVFAGRVGLSQHVVVLHPDGLRTSYSFLAEVGVRRGDHVERGDVVGRAGDELHFGVRAGDTYLDPAALLQGAAPKVHLVPVRGSVEDERSGLVRWLGGAVGAVVHAGVAEVAWARDQVVEQVALQASRLRAQVVGLREVLVLAEYYHGNAARFLHAFRALERYRRDQGGCTPSSVAPRREGRRHLAVLVGGLGSSAGNAAVLDVDTAALGYAPGDVAQFSYRGGQAPGRRTIPGTTTRTYDADDSTGDIRVAAQRLRDLLEELRLTHPGVPVDVIAHSQGGLVARAALADVDRHDPRVPTVDHVVTIGTPHHGADLATAGAALGTSVTGHVAQEAIGLVSGGAVDPTSTAAAQLSERSSFVEGLQDAHWPEGTRVTSIAGSGDAVVTPVAASLGGATNALVPITGASAHDSLPGSAAAQREVALALGDQGPTCRRTFWGLVLGAGVSELVDGLGAAGLVGGNYLDGKLP